MQCNGGGLGASVPGAFFVMFRSMAVTAVCMMMTATTATAQATARPNIVIIMADDMGFNDVSFRGSNQFLTPNIDALAYSGVILNNLYTPAMCTPSRAALLTGKYPINTGMQHYVIPNDQPWGLPLNETTLAEIFQSYGYYTSLIGKWHLGMSRKVYTPTLRGFDHHYGYLGSYIDYYDHTLYSPYKNYSRGHDFRHNFNVSRDHVGKYATNVLTDAAVDLIDTHNTKEQPLFLLLSHLAPHAGNEQNPLQAPPEEIAKFAHIADESRRIYAAMVSELDKSVGVVVDALFRNDMLSNTILLFYSDNGGPTTGMHSNTASNYPLRGQKNSPWEGGVRSSGAIWYPKFERLGTVWKQKIYIADILPTLSAAANIELDPSLELDGLNLWPSLRYGYEAVEREIVHNIDDIVQYTSYVKGKWKFIVGTTENGQYDGWLGSESTEIDPRAEHYEEIIRTTSVWQQLRHFNENKSSINMTKLRDNATIICLYANSSKGMTCNPRIAPCLFDIEVDPCEQNNLYYKNKNTKNVHQLIARIEDFRAHAHRPNNQPTDPFCDPKYYDNEWTWWQDMPRPNLGNTIQYLGSFILGLITVLVSIVR